MPTELMHLYSYLSLLQQIVIMCFGAKHLFLITVESSDASSETVDIKLQITMNLTDLIACPCKRIAFYRIMKFATVLPNFPYRCY